MLHPTEMTCAQMVRTLPDDPTVTERELVLLGHLMATLDEVDTLTRELQAAQGG